MPNILRRDYIDLSPTAQEAFILGARDVEPVRGLTHDFYKYPARFSPTFARSAIEAFTRPGELVLDPHVGGGTTLVEAAATGRNGIGIDISELAEFVGSVKTAILSEAELTTLGLWSKRVGGKINLQRPSNSFSKYVELGYYKHLDHIDRWRLRHAIDQGLRSAIQLERPRLVNFARCAVLRAAQWALDGRSAQANVAEFRTRLEMTAVTMLAGARALRVAAIEQPKRSKIELLRRTAAGLENDKRVRKWGSPKLVVTSPPYPGVHVLYHRWQVDGRKETAFPFMIANKLDGSASSYYTMGDRKNPGLNTYFDNIRATMTSISALATKRTVVVQMIAFSNPSWQLPRYLETLEEAGLKETFLSSLKGSGDGRLWRSVPGRRWYSAQRGDTPASKEVVLIHQKAR